MKTASTLGFGDVKRPKPPRNKKNVEEELRQCFERCKASWEFAEKKTEVVEKKLGTCPRAKPQKPTFGRSS